MAPAARQRPRQRVAVARLPRPTTGLLRGAARIAPSWRSLLVGAALVALALLLYGAAHETSMFAVRTIDVRGASPRVTAQIRSELAPLLGRSLLKVGGGEVDRRLAGLTTVASATVNRDFPHTLRIQISQEQPLAVLRQGASAWLVSADGRVIRTLDRPAQSSLSRIWLPRSASVTEGTTLTDSLAERAVAALRMLGQAPIGARVRDVRTTQDELTLVLRSGLEVRLGDTSNLRFKLAVTRKILPLLTPPGYLDVSVPERAVAASESKVSG